MQLSVREAAERVGVTRQTIFKKIKDGELSATVDHRGNKQVDVSELLRVYGQLQSNDSQHSATVNKVRQLKQSSSNSDLQLDLERSKMLLQMKDRELQLAQERIEELKAREAELKQRDYASTEERMRLLGIIETQNRLLAAPTPTPKVTAPAKPRTAAVAKPKPAAKPQVATAIKKTTTARKQPMAASKPVTKKVTTVARPKSAPTRLKTAPKGVAKTGTKKATKK